MGSEFNQSSPPSTPKTQASKATPSSTDKMTPHHLRPTPIIRKSSRTNKVLRQLININERPENSQIDDNIMQGEGSGESQTADGDNDWTNEEKELYLMGVIKCGKGSWDKIAKEFVPTRTPQQISTYAEAFYRCYPLPSRTGIDLNKKPPSRGFDDDSSSSNTPAYWSPPPAMSTTVEIPVPVYMIRREQQPRQLETLHLFRVEAPFFPQSPENKRVVMKVKPTKPLPRRSQFALFRALAPQLPNLDLTLGRTGGWPV